MTYLHMQLKGNIAFPCFSDNGYITSVRISPSLIDSVGQSIWGAGDSILLFNRPMDYTASIDSSVYLDPLRLVDDNNTVLTTDQIRHAYQAKGVFSVFCRLHFSRDISRYDAAKVD